MFWDVVNALVTRKYYNYTHVCSMFKTYLYVCNLSIYICTLAVFIKREIKNELNVNFLDNRLSFWNSIFIPVSFL